MDGFSRIFRPGPALAGIVEAIWNWEIPDGQVARGAVSIALPCAYPILSIHYGEPIWSDRQRGSGYYRQMATGVQTGVVTFRPSGSSGCVVVRLKPEAATRVIDSSISDFTNANIALEDVFGSGEMVSLQDRLKETRSSSKRIACVEAFLLRHLRHDRSNAIASYAASYLRRDPAQPVHILAERLQVSRRHLSRAFHSTFGVSPKQFARVVRIGKLLAARRRDGLSWADAAIACGFADQAHMINDFNALTGTSPEEFFRAPSLGPRCGFNASLVESHFYNQFFAS
jgi:AraC-like DNA-binding protein